MALVAVLYTRVQLAAYKKRVESSEVMSEEKLRDLFFNTEVEDGQ